MAIVEGRLFSLQHTNHMSSGKGPCSASHGECLTHLTSRSACHRGGMWKVARSPPRPAAATRRDLHAATPRRSTPVLETWTCGGNSRWVLGEAGSTLSGTTGPHGHASVTRHLRLRASPRLRKDKHVLRIYACTLCTVRPTTDTQRYIRLFMYMHLRSQHDRTATTDEPVAIATADRHPSTHTHSYPLTLGLGRSVLRNGKHPIVPSPLVCPSRLLACRRPT